MKALGVGIGLLKKLQSIEFHITPQSIELDNKVSYISLYIVLHVCQSVRSIMNRQVARKVALVYNDCVVSKIIPILFLKLNIRASRSLVNRLKLSYSSVCIVL